jgi:hypothetical protein
MQILPNTSSKFLITKTDSAALAQTAESVEDEATTA